jgi:hypothetical protein
VLASSEHKFLFFHIPKTAGLSIHSVLSHNISDSLMLELTSKLQEQKIIPYTESMPLHINSATLKKTNFDFSEYFTFMVVRNPYERILSQVQQINKSPDLKISVEKLLDKYEGKINFPTDDYFYNKQTFWTENPIDKNFKIYKYENLKNDWEEICQKCNVKFKPLINHNLSRIRSQKRLINNRDQVRIYEIFKEEFELYGYEK